MEEWSKAFELSAAYSEMELHIVSINRAKEANLRWYYWYLKLRILDPAHV